MNSVLMTLLAHLSAQRRLLINAYVSGFLEEDDPLAAAKRLRFSFAERPTQAPEAGTDLDPAVSDLLAAMTDEAIEDFMDRVIGQLQQIDAEVHGAEAERPTSPLATALANRRRA
ncbi:MAG: hypothetical protein RKK15_13460 [Defluviicoccus sp.]|nr:hypothetical protein [Defluviicoccus sp.]